jgi:hypothetical protein
MPLRMTCPRCHFPFTFPDVSKQATARCISCGQLFTISPAAPAAAGEVVNAQVVPQGGAIQPANRPGSLLSRPAAAQAEAWPTYADPDLRRPAEPRPRRRRREKRDGGSATIVVVLAVGGAVIAAALLLVVGMVGIWWLTRSVPPPRPQAPDEAAEVEFPPPAPMQPDPMGPGPHPPMMPGPGAPGAPGFAPGGPGGAPVGPGPASGPGVGQPAGPPIGQPPAGPGMGRRAGQRRPFPGRPPVGPRP